MIIGALFVDENTHVAQWPVKMENGKYGSPDADGHLGLKLKIEN